MVIAGPDGERRQSVGDGDAPPLERAGQLPGETARGFLGRVDEAVPAVAVARKRRLARALELDVPAPAIAVDHFAQQDGAPVAQLRHEIAELDM